MTNPILNATVREFTDIIKDNNITTAGELSTKQQQTVKQGVSAFVEPLSILHEAGCKGANAQLAGYHLFMAQTFFNQAVVSEWNGGKGR